MKHDDISCDNMQDFYILAGGMYIYHCSLHSSTLDISVVPKRWYGSAINHTETERLTFLVAGGTVPPGFLIVYNIHFINCDMNFGKRPVNFPLPFLKLTQIKNCPRL